MNANTVPDVPPRLTPPVRPIRSTGVKKHGRSLIIGLLKYGVGFGLLAYVLITNWNPKGENPGIGGLLEQTPNLVDFLALAAIAVTCTSLQFVRWFLLVRALNLPFTIQSAFR